jgi:type II secretory pathway pseudopilin PulG
MRRDGFTLVELVLAFAIMSFMFVILTSGIVALFHIYQQGLAVRNTQQNARQIAAAMSRDGVVANSFASGSSGNSINLNGWNLDAICYFNGSTAQPSSTTTGIMYWVVPSAGGINVLMRRELASTNSTVCDPSLPAAGGTTDQVMSARDVSIVRFHVVPATAQVPEVQLQVASQYDLDNSDLTGAPNGPAQCQLRSGSQFCAVTSLPITTEVHQ